MKKAYQMYAKHAQRVDEKKAHCLMERAELYGVDFLQNAVLVDDIIHSLRFKDADQEDFKAIAKVWQWVHEVEEKAQMS